MAFMLLKNGLFRTEALLSGAVNSREYLVLSEMLSTQYSFAMR